MCILLSDALLSVNLYPTLHTKFLENFSCVLYFVCTCVCVCVCVCVCARARVHTCIRMCMYIPVCVLTVIK